MAHQHLRLGKCWKLFWATLKSSAIHICNALDLDYSIKRNKKNMLFHYRIKTFIPVTVIWIIWSMKSMTKVIVTEWEYQNYKVKTAVWDMIVIVLFTGVFTCFGERRMICFLRARNKARTICQETAYFAAQKLYMHFSQTIFFTEKIASG